VKIPRVDIRVAYLDSPHKVLDYTVKKYKTFAAEIYWLDYFSLAKGCVVALDRKIVLASVKINEKELRGFDALVLVERIPIALFLIYRMSKRIAKYLMKLNPEYLVAVERAEIAHEDTISRFVKANNVVDGYIIGTCEGYHAEVVVKDGFFVAAYVRYGPEEFKGNSALFYLNVPCRIIFKPEIPPIPEEWKIYSNPNEVLEKIQMLSQLEDNQKIRRLLKILD
jgi:hypothetical protein